MRVKWDVRKAAKNLDIALIPFDMAMDGKAGGYSTPDRELAIHPETRHPIFVALHEMGHIALGHVVSPFGGTTKKFTIMDVIWKQNNLPRHEIEAQIVALEAAFLLGLEPGIDINVQYELAYLENFIKDGLAHEFTSSATSPSAIDVVPSDARVAQLRETAVKIVEAGKL